ncbi:MAG TPA: amino acid ABC transporter substrate-binding protein [Xanthobacteraceae bacterium]|nr:amino acid ABC transporter substrate-binding protein [Xanthobacteraceae bacterium]
MTDSANVRAPLDRRGLMRAGLAAALGLPFVRPAAAQGGACVEDTLDKIKRTGVFALGARQSTPPYGYLDAQNNWVGFATDIARAIHANLEKELKATIELKYVPVTSQTRIPLLQNGTIDMEAGATVVTRSRVKVVDFAVPHFLTSTEAIVHAEGPIKTLADLAGKRVGVPLGGLEEALYRGLNAAGRLKPSVTLVAFPDHPQGFTALGTGTIDAYSSDGPILFGMKAKAAEPAQWRVFDPGANVFLQAFPIRPESSRFKSVADLTIVDAFANGEWDRLYDKYFGPHGVAPFEKTDALAKLALMNAWPAE